jgi:hypothetical protein
MKMRKMKNQHKPNADSAGGTLHPGKRKPMAVKSEMALGIHKAIRLRRGRGNL